MLFALLGTATLVALSAIHLLCLPLVLLGVAETHEPRAERQAATG